MWRRISIFGVRAKIEMKNEELLQVRTARKGDGWQSCFLSFVHSFVCVCELFSLEKRETFNCDYFACSSTHTLLNHVDKYLINQKQRPREGKNVASGREGFSLRFIEYRIALSLLHWHHNQAQAIQRCLMNCFERIPPRQISIILRVDKTRPEF